MSKEKPVPVYKITVRLQEGLMHDDGEIQHLPGIDTDIYIQNLMGKESAQDKSLRDDLAIKAMDALWKKLEER